VSGLRGRTYSERLAELDLPSLAERRMEADMVQTYKILSDDSVNYSEKWFVKMENGRYTRRSTGMMLRLPRAAHNFRRGFFSCRLPEHWNNLPREVKEAGHAGQFKSRYRTHLKNR
jgi:hypothetical protein